MCREWLRRQMRFYEDLIKGKGDKLYVAFGWEWIAVIAVVVLIFGVGKLGNIGGALGKSIREFRQEKDKDKIENTPQLSTKKEEDTQPEAKSTDESKD